MSQQYPQSVTAVCCEIHRSMNNLCEHPSSTHNLPLLKISPQYPQYPSHTPAYGQLGQNVSPQVSPVPVSTASSQDMIFPSRSIFWSCIQFCLLASSLEDTPLVTIPTKQYISNNPILLCLQLCREHILPPKCSQQKISVHNPYFPPTLRILPFALLAMDLEAVLSLSLRPTYTDLRSFAQSHPILFHDFILLLAIIPPASPEPPPAKFSRDQVDIPLKCLLALPTKSQRFILTAIYEAVERSPPSDPFTGDLHLHVLHAVVAFVKSSPLPVDEWCEKLCFMTVAIISRLSDEVLVRRRCGSEEDLPAPPQPCSPLTHSPPPLTAQRPGVLSLSRKILNMEQFSGLYEWFDRGGKVPFDALSHGNSLCSPKRPTNPPSDPPPLPSPPLSNYVVIGSKRHKPQGKLCITCSFLLRRPLRTSQPSSLLAQIRLLPSPTLRHQLRLRLQSLSQCWTKVPQRSCPGCNPSSRKSIQTQCPLRSMTFLPPFCVCLPKEMSPR